MVKYSDSSFLRAARRADRSTPLTLAIDSGSQLVSMALGVGEELLVQVSFPGGPSSPSLLERIDRLLNAIDCRPDQIERMIAARGPGSFTGLRSGLATLLGLGQALGVPATAIPTFLPLAAQAPRAARVLAAIDALRGEWFVQAFDERTLTPSSEAVIMAPAQLVAWLPFRLVAFGSHRLAEQLPSGSAFETQEAQPLAQYLLAFAADPSLDWNRGTLTSPLYLRPPAATPPTRPDRS